MLFQAKINESDSAILSSLKSELAIKKNPDFFSHLLVIVQWMVAERRAGRKIVSYSEDKDAVVRELVDPVLERAVQRRQIPKVVINWTDDELRDLASLAAAEAPQPTPALMRAMSE